MTFDPNNVGTAVDRIRREILAWDQFGDTAPSLAIAAWDDAA